MATQEEFDNLHIMERVGAAFDSLIDQLQCIDQDIKNLKIKIQVTGCVRYELDSLRKRSEEKIQAKLKDWEKRDPHNAKALVVGPDFKFHTREEMAAMIGHKLKG